VREEVELKQKSKENKEEEKLGGLDEDFTKLHIPNDPSPPKKIRSSSKGKKSSF
jgi:hypothetical protein